MFKQLRFLSTQQGSQVTNYFKFNQLVYFLQCTLKLEKEKGQVIENNLGKLIQNAEPEKLL